MLHRLLAVWTRLQAIFRTKSIASPTRPSGGSVEGTGLLDLASTAAQIHYYAAGPAINVTTAAAKTAVHKLSHPAVTSHTHP